MRSPWRREGRPAQAKTERKPEDEVPYDAAPSDVTPWLRIPRLERRAMEGGD